MSRIKNFLHLCLIFTCLTYAFANDIQSENTGEQAMIKALRTAINHDQILKEKPIIIGAGQSGTQAFTAAPKQEKIHILLTWQWLDSMKNLANGTYIVMPQHAIDENLKAMQSNVNLIEIQGVFHTRTLDNIKGEKADSIDQSTHIILMLGGDTEQQDGTWKRFTKEMAEVVVNALPQDKNILILNGPRTGKHQDSDTITLDATAHKTTPDHVTAHVQTISHNKWNIQDFQYGKSSLWGPALKFCLDHPKTALIIPGESTSMISECLTLGIRPIIYKHEAMTATSKKYVDLLVAQGKASFYPFALLEEAPLRQEPAQPQELVVVEKLKKIFFPA